ncbi:hypothetical protein FYF77_18360 [Vibrio cholerae]|nr:hypothetical protein [Vibrio cholerae]EGQ9901549.1 hypothetical protein [Vibrio cholerae]EGR0076732.1 hypothetical protein [Vibrio cholerae]EGR0567403.1 hypothetical protein [Vibrio cholerae]RNE84527.1 hypothetical protein EEJ38_17430 [Vibrio cholerae]
MSNARLRGWQRITTKLKHNNRNPRGSLGLETPRVGSPFEAFVMSMIQRGSGLFLQVHKLLLSLDCC